jgi:dihydrofolate synthase/folylpolyglutamate synthase
MSGDNLQDNGGEEPTYQDALDFIKNLTKFGINLGLGRMRTLLQRMGEPQAGLRFIHIGGTNGKGSTTAILQAILKQAGFRAGMFTSPHLHDYRERIRINDALISQQDVVKGIARIKPVLLQMVDEGMEHPTEFEVCTALGLCYFAEKKPDFVLLEVGLGGEIDSTNVVTPLVSVLTSIGMDHMDYLGKTLTEIAKVKAGIIKPGIPVVTSADKPEALRVIEQSAREKGSALLKVGTEVTWEKARGERNVFSYRGIRHSYDGLALSLLGEHQLTNAATALAVCEVLEELGHLKLEETVIRQGLENVRWPGRLELVPGNPKILLDGAHNVDGMETLIRALYQYKDGLLQRKRLWLCLGILQDKEVKKIIDLIAPLADEIIVTKPDSPRAGDWRAVARLAEKYLNPARVHAIEAPAEAVEEGLKRMGPDDLLCVTGSLYMISVVRKHLLESPGIRPSAGYRPGLY